MLLHQRKGGGAAARRDVLLPRDVHALAAGLVGQAMVVTAQVVADAFGDVYKWSGVGGA